MGYRTKRLTHEQFIELETFLKQYKRSVDLPKHRYYSASQGKEVESINICLSEAWRILCENIREINEERKGAILYTAYEYLKKLEYIDDFFKPYQRGNLLSKEIQLKFRKELRKLDFDSIKLLVEMTQVPM